MHPAASSNYMITGKLSHGLKGKKEEDSPLLRQAESPRSYARAGRLHGGSLVIHSEGLPNTSERPCLLQVLMPLASRRLGTDIQEMGREIQVM